MRHGFLSPPAPSKNIRSADFQHISLLHTIDYLIFIPIRLKINMHNTLLMIPKCTFMSEQSIISQDDVNKMQVLLYFYSLFCASSCVHMCMCLYFIFHNWMHHKMCVACSLLHLQERNHHGNKMKFGFVMRVRYQTICIACRSESCIFMYACYFVRADFSPFLCSRKHTNSRPSGLSQRLTIIILRLWMYHSDNMFCIEEERKSIKHIVMYSHFSNSRKSIMIYCVRTLPSSLHYKIMLLTPQTFYHELRTITQT